MLFRRRRVLGEPQEPLRDFWVSAEVRLSTPIDVVDEDESRPVIGYIRNFGIRATHERLSSVVTAEITDGRVLWDHTEWYEIDPSTLDSVIRKRILPVDGEGIWYRSGRAFYPEDDESTTDVH